MGIVDYLILAAVIGLAAAGAIWKRKRKKKGCGCCCEGCSGCGAGKSTEKKR